MKNKMLYIAQKNWMAKFPKLVTYDILEAHNKLYDMLVMQKVLDNEELDDKPYYNLDRQEIILETYLEVCEKKEEKE